MTTATPTPAPPAGPAAACCAPTTTLDPGLDTERITRLARALSEPVRVQILDLLRRHGEPLCQCELNALFDIPQATLSRYVKTLVDAGLVEVERRHRWAYYSIPADALKELTPWLS
jgi:ArsR family transcriptional regulator